MRPRAAERYWSAGVNALKGHAPAQAAGALVAPSHPEWSALPPDHLGSHPSASVEPGARGGCVAGPPRTESPRQSHPRSRACCSGGAIRRLGGEGGAAAGSCE